MINIINDVRDSLKHGNYYSALALALTLPDICMKSENKDGRQEYINWVDKYIFTDKKYCAFAKFHKDIIVAIGFEVDEYFSELQKLQQDETLYKVDNINGTIMYALRCSFLHAGNVKVDTGKHPLDLKISLGIPNSKIKDVPLMSYGFNYKKEAYAKLDVITFCNVVCDKVEKYYIDNSNNFKNILSIQTFYTFDNFPD